MKTNQPKRLLAKEVKRTDGASAFRLDGTDRIEWLSPIRAFARNRSRSDNRQWKIDPSAFADQVKESPIPASKLEWQRRYAEGIRKDNETAAIRAKAQEEIEMKTKTEKSEKSTAAKTEKAESTRAAWKGMGMCELIRYCGKKGFGKTKTLSLMKKLGLDPNPATISIQLRKGKNGENVPEMAKELRGEFTKFADAIPNDEKKAPKAEGKAGKTKTAKSEGGKAEGKKSKKNKVPKAAESENEDDAEAALAQARADAADAEDGETEEEDADGE